MMEELLLINPRKRSKKKMATKHRRHRTAAQKAATRRLVAFNRARRRPAARSYTANPRRRRRHSMRSYTPNPVRRHHRRAAHRRHYRRNPSLRMGGGRLMPLLMGSFQGALGAIVVNMGYNYIPLPATLKTGRMQYVAKAGLAIALGMIARNRMVSKMVEGSLTVTMYDAIKDLAGGSIPGMAGLGMYVSPGYHPSATPALRGNPAPRFIGNAPAGMGEYMNMSGVDEYMGNTY